MCGNFSTFRTPSLGHRSPAHNPLFPLLSLSFALLHSEEIGDSAEVWVPLPVFRSCSMGIVPHAMVFYVFVGENVASPSYSSTIPPHSCVLKKLSLRKSVERDFDKGS